MRRLLMDRRLWLTCAIVGGLLAVALWPVREPVDVAAVTRGPMAVTVDEEGRTRIRRRFVVSAPTGGRVLRIELEPGDRVRRGEVVARIQPDLPALLDERTRGEARAAVAAARAALGRARAEDARTRAALAQADRDLAQSRRLVAAGAVADQELEVRETEARIAGEAARAATFAVGVATAELQRAEARLAPPTPAAGGAIAVTAPVDGVILRRLRESESAVPAGEPLVEIGDPRALEIVADLLSTDAVRVKPGAAASIEQWGRDDPLRARVRLVEPSGFTRVSALGVEEQRVNVVLDLIDADDRSAALGDGYRVELRIVTWEAAGVIRAPTSALVRDGARWAVYEAVGGRARRTHVEIGQRNGAEAEVRAGLSEGARVIVHPGDRIADGVRVRERRREDAD